LISRVNTWHCKGVRNSFKQSALGVEVIDERGMVFTRCELSEEFGRQ